MNVRILKIEVILGILLIIIPVTLTAQSKLHDHAHLGHDDGIESKEEHLRWESETAHSLLKSIIEMTEQFQIAFESGEIHSIHLKLEDFVEHLEHLPEMSEELLSDEALFRVFKTGNSLDTTIIQMDDNIHKKDLVELQKNLTKLNQLVSELRSHYPKKLINQITRNMGDDHSEKDHNH
ncbi:MAG: hypothetical protein KJT03_00440 [Verrucomicrobiae bacterium]|nr:hypothetical protein [Verrucomicrobiae bacterium]